MHTIIIPVLANILYVLRYRTLRMQRVRLIVFTGTSGKTLARSAVTYALKQNNIHVISPPFGYTNELGIVLAALGIESIKLFSLKGLWKMLTMTPKEHSYACVELGADFRFDIPWFVKRFKPYGVCLVDVTDDEWARPFSSLLEEKQLLINYISSSGFVAVSTHNPSYKKIETFTIPKGVTYIPCTSTKGEDSTSVSSFQINNTHTFTHKLSSLMPYREAFGFGYVVYAYITDKKVLPQTFFENYIPPEERLSNERLPNGTVLISDTYKSTPYCASYVLHYALSIPKEKHIAIVSAMHPLWSQLTLHYERMATILQKYDTVYFIAPRYLGNFFARMLPSVILVPSYKEYTTIAKKMRQEKDTVIVIKSAGRYNLGELLTMIRDVADTT